MIGLNRGNMSRSVWSRGHEVLSDFGVYIVMYVLGTDEVKEPERRHNQFNNMPRLWN